MNRKTLRVVYWTLTALFCSLQGWAALQYLLEAPRMMESIRALGYPIYFVKLLGVAKLLGIAAIVYGGFPRLKEWAYAGFTFDTLGAFFSHVSSGDSVLIAAVPLLFCAAQPPPAARAPYRALARVSLALPPGHGAIWW